MYISYELHVTGFRKTNEPVNKQTEFIINFYFLYLVIRFAIINYELSISFYSSLIASIGLIFMALLAGINPAKVPIIKRIKNAAMATLKLI